MQAVDQQIQPADFTNFLNFLAPRLGNGAVKRIDATFGRLCDIGLALPRPSSRTLTEKDQ